MKKFNIFKILLVVMMLGLVSCEDELYLTPPDKLSPTNAFRTEDNLQLYVNSFYSDLPTSKDISRSDAMSDYLVGRTISSYLQNTFNANMASHWNWGTLRNINYFLEHYRQAEISESAKNHFEGVGRFFRAYFYYKKVKRFGDVPWYGKVMDVDDPDIFKPRDPRTLVMDSVLADINFACGHIREMKDATSSEVTKWVALAMKSRICLYEGTYRKYHTELGLQATADEWLRNAAEAAEELMNSGKYSINMREPLDKSYRQLFIQEMPESNEVILAALCSADLRVLNDANWYWTSATYGGRYSFTKSFINTYLNIDGTRFTDESDHDEIPFWDEVKDRDLRLKQTIRLGDYSREGQPAPPDFTYTYTGYHPLKFTLDSKATDGVAENNNSLPIIRYAEVLLNYAEAKAELGTFTTQDWNKTIRILRQRAGISNTAMPTTADTYLQENFYPDITDPVLLEIRRERGIELAMEGFRYDDIKRWKEGPLMEKVFDGMYVPALDSLLDLNEDGKPDVCFVNTIPDDKVSGVYYFLIDNEQYKLSDLTKGTLILYTNIERSYPDYKYLYPIPYDEIVLNPNLEQNPGWD